MKFSYLPQLLLKSFIDKLRLTFCIMPLTVMISACGDLDQLVEHVADSISEQDEVLEGSYMVAFRSDQLWSHQRFQLEYGRVNASLLWRFKNEPSVKDIFYYGSFDLAEDSEAFLETASQLNPYRAKQLNYPAVLTRVDFYSMAEAERTLREWEEEGRIYYAEPNGISRLSVSKELWAGLQTQYSSQSIHALHSAIGTVAAFQSLSQKVSEDYSPIIAVMDSGIDIEHPAIKNRIWRNDAIGQAGCGNDDYYGCNTTKPQSGSIGNGDVAPFGAAGHNSVCPSAGGGCESTCCHGTHVAGIIAGDITAGVAGVCPRCQIMVLRVVGESPMVSSEKATGVILDSSIAGALRYIASFRNQYGKAVRIINASFGKFQRSKSISVLVRGISNTPRNAGALIIGAAGNEDSNRIQYPAGFDDAIAVSNLRYTDRSQSIAQASKNPTSNFGRWVDIAAPGTDIPSCVPGESSPVPKSGTSMAAPVVAGIAGLVLVANPSISTSDLRDALIQSSDATIYDGSINQNYLAQIPGERSSIPLLGAGMVHAQRAVDQQATEGRSTILGLDRVERGCGVVGFASQNSNGYLLLLLVLLPGFILIWPYRR
jgi:hypothetical protein